MELTADRRLYVGVFLLTLATMLFEILLTRVFSVTTFYHFAFLSVSAAMLGLAYGAIYVYKSQKLFSNENIHQRMALSCLLFGLISLASIAIHLSTPLIVGFANSRFTLASSIALAFPGILAAFMASGVCVCLALTRFPNAVNKIYAFDLGGAACGCAAIVFLLNYIDLFACLLVVALCSTIAALVLVSGKQANKTKIFAYIMTLLIVLLIGVQTISASSGHPWLRLSWSKGHKESDLIYEKWNAFSRIRIFGDREARPQPWDDPAMNARAIMTVRVPSLTIDIDANASTKMLHYNGKLEMADFLQHATTAVPHRLRPGGAVAIVGVGGGKDVLTALVNHPKSVLGLEINQDIIRAVTVVLGDYAGHFDQTPGVKIVCDDARSAITGLPDKFDIIQASLVDTWAASSSGTYALSENGLYTLDCWRVFLEHIKPGGIVTMTRWFEPDSPTEFYRLTNLAAEALRLSGVQDPRQNMIALRNKPIAKENNYSVGTLIISKEPFSAVDLNLVDEICKKEGFEEVLTPRSYTDPILSGLASADHSQVVASYPFDISAPTDDKPFFFQTIVWKNLFRQLATAGGNIINVQAGLVPFVAAIFVLISAFTILNARRDVLKDWHFSVSQAGVSFYFFLIGLGFMLVEISQMQRLTIFLGHPNYGLSVALFTFLLAGALGSFIGGKVKPGVKRDISIRFAGAIVILLISVCICLPMLHAFSAYSMLSRIALAVATMFPTGFVLGMPFPIGMSIVNLRHQALAAWLWGVNGAASVLGSFLAIALSMTIGITATFWLAILLYLLAYFAALTALKI